MSQYTDKFYGPFKILGVEDTGNETPNGTKLVKIHLDSEDNPYEVTTEKALDLFHTDDRVDDNTFQEKKFEVLINRLVETTIEYDVRFFELKRLVQGFADAMEDIFERASSLLWTGDDNLWTQGQSYLTFRTLAEGVNIIEDGRPEEEETEE